MSVKVFPTDSSRVDRDLSILDADAEKIRSELKDNQEDLNNKNWVQLKIDNMVRIDQLLRKSSGSIPLDNSYTADEKKYFENEIGNRIRSCDEENTSVLKRLLIIYKWFTISEFGEKIDNQAWLLAQHADQDSAFQKQVLIILSELYKLNETSPSNYAYMFDRVAASWGDITKRTLQRYGTQGVCMAPSKWEPLAMEEPEKLDQRRAGVGLPPMAEYLSVMNGFCK